MLVLVRNMKITLIYVYENKPAFETHFQMNGFARKLVLLQRQKTTRKWHHLSHCHNDFKHQQHLLQKDYL